MRDSIFLKVIAVAALLVAAAYVSTPLWAPAGSPAAPYACASGAGAGSLIAFVQEVQSVEKLYLIETSSKVLLVYDNGFNGNAFNFVHGRAINFDVIATQKMGQQGQEMPFNPRGYPWTSVRDRANMP